METKTTPPELTTDTSKAVGSGASLDTTKEPHKKLPPLPVLNSQLENSKTSLPTLSASFLDVERAVSAQATIRSQVVLEMGAFDQNLEAVREILGRKVEVRVNAQALCNPSLLLYVSERIKSKKLAITDPGFLVDLWQHPGFGGFDFLFNSNFPAQLLPELLSKLDSEARARALGQTSFLVGTIDEIVAWQKAQVTLKVPIKVYLNMSFGSADIGFRRFSDLERAIKRLDQVKNQFSIQGVFVSDGYDASAPRWFSKWISSSESRFARVQSRILRVKETFRNLAIKGNIPVLGGASSTFGLHAKGTHLEEILLGSVFFNFKEKALFVSAPILGHETQLNRPFIGFFSRLYSKILKSDFKVVLLGVQKSSVNIPEFFSLKGFSPAPWGNLVRERQSHSQFWLPRSMAKKVGEPILFYAKGARILKNFSELLLVRKGQILGTSKNFSHRTS